MTLERSSDTNLAYNDDIAGELAQLGIICVPIDNFYYREFHYTNLEDAKAQVERDRKRIGLSPSAPGIAGT